MGAAISSVLRRRSDSLRDQCVATAFEGAGVAVAAGSPPARAFENASASADRVCSRSRCALSASCSKILACTRPISSRSSYGSKTKSAAPADTNSDIVLVDMVLPTTIMGITRDAGRRRSVRMT